MGYMMPSPWCAPTWMYVVVHELDVDPSSTAATGFIGAGGASGTTVEYLVDTGAPAPQVSVDIATSGPTTNWQDTGIAPGFHVQHFGSLPAGAKVTLSATDAMARLRWCEVFSC